MYTSQIIILTVIAILFLYLNFRILNNFVYKFPINNRGDFTFSILGIIFLFSLILTVSIDITIKYNDICKKLKNKCPEYEKIENVYKLKN